MSYVSLIRGDVDGSGGLPVQTDVINLVFLSTNTGGVSYSIGKCAAPFLYTEEGDLKGFGAPHPNTCLLYTSPSPRDRTRSRMPSSA